MMDVANTVRALREHGLDRWADLLPVQWAEAFGPRRHGDLDRWLAIVAALPALPASDVDLNAAAITAGGQAGAIEQARIRDLLQGLKPWRKGPYGLHGVFIDTEWRSDWKWHRLAPHIQPLSGRRVLDVGCGNGYHCWRMAGAGAALVVGIDPTQLFIAQFLAVQHFVGAHWPVHLLPLGIEQVPAGLKAFDTVFSMGVLYHRRSPMDHLMELRDTLRPGGELVLETLVIDGAAGQVLVPAGRYAKMRNVWFLPSAAELAHWIRRCGFTDVRVVDVTPTSIEEQRATDWMDFESLPDFLDLDDPGLTVEGHPAPRRAILLARA
jgi:tRNA (mo5U34)-methyltransferase